MSRNHHILVIRLSAMGDVAMTVPVIRAFVQQYPEVKLTIVSRGFFEPFFKDIPNVSFFKVEVDKRHKGFLGLLRLFYDLKKLDINAVADLHNVIRSKTIKKLFAFIGTKTAASSKERKQKEALTRAKNKKFAPLKTVFQLHCDTFKNLGFPVNLDKPVFPKKEPLSTNIIQITGNKTNFWIGIAPFAQYESKVYPFDLTKLLLEKLEANPNYTIFLFGGGKREKELLTKLCENKKRTINTAGIISFQEEIQLISNLDCMISMDSGNAHIAAMLGLPVITLWGATHPFAGFMPFNQSLENAIISDRKQYPMLPTSIYGKKTVNEYQDAMRTINPDEVVQKVNDVINNL
jgi:ADP-heptose:LPS heptosyltransferase